MRSLFTYWHMDNSMAVFLVIVVLLYFYFTRFKIIERSVYFFSGMLLIILSVASPLHFLGLHYLMSAHMASHVIILLIAAPLLVLGLPLNSDNKILIRFSAVISKLPWLAWLSGVCIMWFWHIPAIFNILFNTSVQADMHSSSPAMNILQNIHLMSLVLAGILFSWPIIGPIKNYRIVPLNAVLYLSIACVFCSILGLLITFAPTGIFTAYSNIQDKFGLLSMIRNQNGISMLVDQQIGGLIMWVPGCLIYLTASMYLLMKWFNEKREDPVLSSPNIIS